MKLLTAYIPTSICWEDNLERTTWDILAYLLMVYSGPAAATHKHFFKSLKPKKTLILKLRTYFFLQNFPHQKLVNKCKNENLKMLTETRQIGPF